MDVNEFSDSLGQGEAYTPPPPHALLNRELVYNRKTGSVRQAGSLDVNGRFFQIIRKRAERDLFFTAKSILGFNKLTRTLHKEVCTQIQRTPPYRKMILIPRDCFKTTIASKALPIHKFIQPKEHNIYWPGHDGLETKILLTCETINRASKHLQIVEAHFEKNPILRALWPHKCWDNPKREARAWNSEEFYLPRDIMQEQSDPSMQAMGVDGTVTGAHPTDLIHDDLVTFKAAQSETIMQSAIDWHTVSRALMEEQEYSMEYIVGTRWAVNDLYGHLIDNDPTVHQYVRSLLENGQSIFPELFPTEYVKNHMRKAYGHMFPLLYMNDPRDASLIDFPEAKLRFYTWNKDYLEYEEDERDNQILELMTTPEDAEEAPRVPRGTEMDSWEDAYDVTKTRDNYLMGKT